MKNREKVSRLTTTKQIIKGLFMATLVSTMFVACGKENESGSSSKKSNDPWSGGITNSGNGSMTLASDWKQRIFNDYPCQIQDTNGNITNPGRTRINIQVPQQYQSNAGELSAGVTTTGDVLIISNTNNKTTVEFYACKRQYMQNTAQFMDSPITYRSSQCALGEIAAANILLATQGTQTGYEYLPFFALNLSAPSSLCQNGNNGYQTIVPY
jgi:hypothetical protein